VTRTTIAAIATPPGRGGIGIVRISGDQTPHIARTLLGQLPAPRHAQFATFRDADGSIKDWHCTSLPRIRSPASTCWNYTAMVARW